MVAACAVLASACGTERSAEAFCSTLREEKQRILDQFNAGANPDTEDELLKMLSGLGASVQAMGELRTYFNKLEKVAPEEIQTEVEIVAGEWGRQVEDAGDAASDPLGGLTSALVGGLATSGQLEAVNRYALRECGEGI
jgi:hypothetical protein